MVECQQRYIAQAATLMRDQGLRYLDVLPKAERAFNDELQRRSKNSVYTAGCHNWYLTADGFNASMYPGLATQYLRQMRQFRLDDYHAVAHEVRARAVTSTA